MFGSSGWVLLLFIIGSDGKTYRDNSQEFAWEYPTQQECEVQEVSRQRREPNHEYFCVNTANSCMTDIKQGRNRRTFTPECLRERY